MGAKRKIKTRLLTRVKHVGVCWIWQGAITTKGYGKIGIGGTVTEYTHRLSYQLHRGPIPRGKLVLHTCDVRRCINPDHLYIGTAKRNTADMLERNREAYGEHSGTAKVTIATTDEIIRLYRCGWTQQAIGEMVGLTQGQVSRILNNKAWTKARHLRVAEES